MLGALALLQSRGVVVKLARTRNERIYAGIKPVMPQRADVAVEDFDGFTPDNDPYAEHDFGVIKLRGNTFFWKFDYFDLDLQMHSPDPSDPAVTARVLTVMLAEEY